MWIQYNDGICLEAIYEGKSLGVVKAQFDLEGLPSEYHQCVESVLAKKTILCFSRGCFDPEYNKALSEYNKEWELWFGFPWWKQFIEELKLLFGKPSLKPGAFKY